MKRRPTSVERLVKRACRDLGVDEPDRWEFHRVYAGHWQRAQGAWSWYITVPDNGSRKEWLASHYPVSELLKTKELSYSQGYGTPALELDPKE